MRSSLFGLTLTALAALALLSAPAAAQRLSGPPGATPTGGSTWRSLADIAGDVLNGKSSGMVCDGVTDDTAALQAAVTAVEAKAPGGGGSVLQLPPGFCIINGTISVTAGVVIRGSGNAGIVSQDNSGTWILQKANADVFQVETKSAVGFEDLAISSYNGVFSGPPPNSAGACISLNGASGGGAGNDNSQSFIDNVTCQLMYDGLRLDEASNLRVRNFQVIGFAHDGILKINSANPDSGQDSYSGLNLWAFNDASTGTEGASPFATTLGSNVVTVTHSTTGLYPGTIAVWNNGAAITVNGTTISGYNVIQTIVDSTHLTIDGSGNAGSTGSGGGTPTYWYGPNAAFEYRAGGDIAISGSKLSDAAFGFLDNATYGPTGSIRLTGNSLETAKVANIGLVQAVSTVAHKNLSIVGNEFEDSATAVEGLLWIAQGTNVNGSPWTGNIAFVGNHSEDFVSTAIPALNIQDGSGIAISGNALSNSGTSGATAISIAGNAQNVTLGLNQITGYPSGIYGAMNWPAVDPGRPPAPNLLLNGSMAIDQANEGATTNLSGTATYAADGWFTQTQTAASGVAAQQVAVTSGPPAQYALKVTIGTGSATVSAGDYMLIRQKIEASQLQALDFGAAGPQTISLSYWLDASVAGTYAATVQNTDGSRSNVNNCTVAANTWTRCAVVVPGDTGGIWTLAGNGTGMWFNLALEAGSTWQTASPGIWVGANNFATAAQTELSQTTGASLQLTAAKLEVSPVPTPFATRPYAQELLLSQRYYRKTFPAGTKPAQNGGLAGALCAQDASATAGTAGVYFPFAPPMRAAPTITTYNPSAANANWRDVTGSADLTVSVDPGGAKSTTGVNIGEATSAMTAGHTMCIQATADARL